MKLPAVLGLLPLLLRPEPPLLHYQVAGGFRLSEVLGGLIRIPFRFQGQVTPKEGLDALRPYLRRERESSPGIPLWVKNSFAGFSLNNRPQIRSVARVNPALIHNFR